MSSSHDYAARYTSRGWCPVPVHRPAPDSGQCTCGKPDCPNLGKHPDGRFWPTGSPTAEDFAGRNVGVRLGPDSGNLADIDLDCGEAVAAGRLLLPHTDAAFGRGGQAAHLLYTVSDAAASYLKLQDPVLESKDATIVELRWPRWDEDEKRFKAFQTVFPPSLHSSGDTVQWIRDGEPAPVAGAELMAAVHHVAAAVLIARYARPNERHALVLLLANLLVRAGWADDKKIVQFMIAVFTAKKDADKVAKITAGEGINAVKDARKRLRGGKPMTGLPALREMLDSALDEPTAKKVVARVKEWLGVPDTPASTGTTEQDWEPPIPLPEPPGVPPFPAHLFPPQVADYWTASAAALNVPVDYVACPALTVLGAAIGRSRAAAVKQGYEESPLFWVVTLAPPGSTKSASLNAGRRPLDAAEARWRATHGEARRALEREMGRYDLELKDWKKNPVGDPPERPDAPPLRQALLDDTTAEAASKVLADNPRGVLLLKDELIGFARMLNQYKASGGGNDKAFWLTGWNGRGVSKVNRSGTHDDGPLVCVDPFTAVGGMMCPDCIPELREELNRGVRANDGWADRFLWSYPDPVPDVGENWQVVPNGLERGYSGVIDALLALEMVDSEGSLRPALVSFDPLARQSWEQFTRSIAERKNRLHPDDPYRGVLSKLRHYGLRFACLFHCLSAACGGPGTGEVLTARSMDAAAEMVAYFDLHGRRCLGLGSADTKAAHRLLAVLAGWDGGSFSKRQLYQRVRGQSAFRTAGSLDGPLKELTTYGFIRAGDKDAWPGRPSERFLINPLWDRRSGVNPKAGILNILKTPAEPGNPSGPTGQHAHPQNEFCASPKPAATRTAGNSGEKAVCAKPLLGSIEYDGPLPGISRGSVSFGDIEDVSPEGGDRITPSTNPPGTPAVDDFPFEEVL